MFLKPVISTDINPNISTKRYTGMFFRMLGVGLLLSSRWVVFAFLKVLGRILGRWLFCVDVTWGYVSYRLLPEVSYMCQTFFTFLPSKLVRPWDHMLLLAQSSQFHLSSCHLPVFQLSFDQHSLLFHPFAAPLEFPPEFPPDGPQLLEIAF